MDGRGRRRRLESQMAVIEPEGVGGSPTEERTKARVVGRTGERKRRRSMDGDVAARSICGCKLRPRKS